MDDPTADLTPAQRDLYATVIADFSGRELRAVIAEQDASDADKAAVHDALYANPLGQ